MIKIKNSLKAKLLLFVLTISFVLIGGSLTFFYFSGERFIISNSIKELQNYSERFKQSVNNKIDFYTNIVSSVILNLNTENLDESLLKNVGSSLKNKTGKIEEAYLQYNDSSKSILIYPITVFGGKQIINSTVIDKEQFRLLYNSIKITTSSNNNAEFGYIQKELDTDFYLRKKTEQFTIIIKLSKLSFLEDIIDNIYYTDEINFCVVGNNNVITYSTNKFWINQKTVKYLTGESINENYFADNDKKIIYGKWKTDILKSEIIIIQNVAAAYKKFHDVLKNILLYSIFIYLLITIFTIIYINRISKSLHKVTDIARKVGEGDFNNKIDIKRNDELGILIEVFNNMVEELKTSYNKLNVTNLKLKEKLDELTRTRTELSKKQKLALIGETISKISHEIQNKISGVSIWVQNLELQVNENENISLYVKEIKNSLNSFIAMLQNFKKFYRRPYLEKQKTDFVKIVEDIVEKYKSDTNEKKIKIEKKIHCNEKNIILDEILITEVIENLLVNAIYFSPENSTILIEILNEKFNIILKICDEGPGIPDENIDNIFHPFFTTKSSGSGLGLAIAKNIVEAHNGTIDLVREYKMGACFKIILPIN